MVFSAGAIVAELIDDKKLKSDIGRSVVHFRLVGQFLGFSGSSGPLHVTCEDKRGQRKSEDIYTYGKCPSERLLLFTKLGSSEVAFEAVFADWGFDMLCK